MIIVLCFEKVKLTNMVHDHIDFKIYTQLYKLTYNDDNSIVI